MNIEKSPNTSENVQVKIKIYGEVQGVFFRVSAKEKANELGVSCEAQNMPNGTVEIKAEGDKEAVSHFTKWCEAGPDSAKVKKVEITELK